MIKKSRYEQIEVNNLEFHYGNEGHGIHVEHVLLHAGDCLGVIGPNGSGKTTFLKLILCLLPLQKGTIMINGNKKYKVFPDLGYLPTFTHSFFTGATVKEEILNTASRVNTEQEHVQEVLNDWHEHLSKSPFLLSLGEQQRLVFDLLELQDPFILILDEPGKGLDPIQKKEFHERVKAWLREGKIVLVSSHYASTILGLCSKLLVLSVNGHAEFFESVKPGIVFRETIVDSMLVPRNYRVEEQSGENSGGM